MTDAPPPRSASSVRHLAGVGTLVRDSAWSLAARLITSLSFFGFITLAVKLLGERLYGEFSLFLMVAQCAYLIGLVWLQGGIVRFGREEFLEHGRANRTLTAHLTLGLPLLAIILAALCFGRHWVLGYLHFAPVYLWVIAAFLLANYLAELLYYYLQAVGEMRLFAQAQMLEKTVPFLIFLVSLIFVPVPRVASLVGSLALGYLAASAWMLGRDGGRRLLPPEFRGDLFRRFLIFSFPLWMNGVLTFFFNWIDVGLIRRYLGIEMVGQYNYCQQLYLGLNQVNQVVSLVAVPLATTCLARQRKDLLEHFVSDFALIGMVAMALVVNLLWLVMAGFLGFLFTQELFATRLALLALFVSLPMSFYALLVVVVLVAYEKTWSVSLGALAGLIVKIAVCWCLMRLLGLGVIGAGLSTFAYLIVAIGCNVLALRRRLSFAVGAHLSFFLLLALQIALFAWTRHVLLTCLLNLGLTAAFAVAARVWSPEKRRYLAQLDWPAAARPWLARLGVIAGERE